jgi:hypothetical protein
MQDPPTSKNPAEHWHSALPEEDSASVGHVSQVAVPTASLNVPAVHALHATPSEAAVCPAKHVQFALPAEELVFEWHARQVPAPATALYVPASHAEHATPSEAAVYPDRHEQFVDSMLPSDDTVFEGHDEQLFDPALALYSPAKHAAHSPPNPVYPAGHGAMHSGTSGRLSAISPPPSPRLSTSPRPSWPLMLRPQHLTLASSSSAHE